MKLHASLAGVVLSICLSPVAFADTNSTSLLENFSKLTQDLLQYDTNKDGIISADEIAAAKAAEFTKIDTDADGYITWAEFKAAQDIKLANRIASIIKIADKNADGTISSEEFINIFSAGQNATQAATIFAIVDADGSGGLSAAEITAILASNEPIMLQIGRFASLDTNGDAKLSQDEFVAKLPKLPIPPKLPKPKDIKLPTIKLPDVKWPDFMKR